MSSDIDMVAEKARQEVAMKRWMSDMVEVASGQEIGKWFPPSGMETMVFQRCGARLPDGSMPPACAEAYHRARSTGASDAPKGMRPPVGYERDGAAGVYVYWHPEIWANIQLFTANIRKRKQFSAEATFQDEMSKLGPQVEITQSGRKRR
jgi:hypothetical protein